MLPTGLLSLLLPPLFWRVLLWVRRAAAERPCVSNRRLSPGALRKFPGSTARWVTFFFVAEWGYWSQLNATQFPRTLCASGDVGSPSGFLLLGGSSPSGVGQLSLSFSGRQLSCGAITFPGVGVLSSSADKEQAHNRRVPVD